MSTNNKQAITGAVAAKVATAAADKAKSTSGWQRWLWGIGAAIAAAVAWFCQGDTQQQPEVTPPATLTPAE